MPARAGSHERVRYVPEGISWRVISRDHHRVYLRRMQPGRIRATVFLIGDVRREPSEGVIARRWRAFPEGALEFPELFENHVLALQHLKEVWEAQALLVRVEAPRRHSAPRNT